jgi:hypothetical protein
MDSSAARSYRPDEERASREQSIRSINRIAIKQLEPDTLTRAPHLVVSLQKFRAISL